MMIAPAGREEIAACVPAIASEALGVHVRGREDARAGDTAAGNGAVSVHSSVGAFDHRAAGDASSGGNAAVNRQATGGVQAGVGRQAEKVVKSVAAERFTVTARAEAG